MNPFNSYLGIDLHKTVMTIAVLDASGATVEIKTMPTKCVGRIRRFFEDLPGPVACAIEAVGMYRWLWDLAKPLCDKLVLADAVELSYRRGRRRPKTDRNDAKHLAELLYTDQVPVAYVPEGAEFDLRRLGRQWHANSRLLTGLKIRMRWFLNQANLRGPKNLDGPSARRWLLAHGAGLDDLAAECVADLLGTIEHLEVQRLHMRRRIKQLCDRHFGALTVLLETVTGISTILAGVIIGEVGDFARFHSAEAFACYTGLTRRVHESAGHVSATGISRAGSRTLRWGLYEAATTLTRCDRQWKARYERWLKKMGCKKKARTAVARKLAACLWGMAKTGECFRRGPTTHPTKAANHARLARQTDKPAA